MDPRREKLLTSPDIRIAVAGETMSRAEKYLRPALFISRHVVTTRLFVPPR